MIGWLKRLWRRVTHPVYGRSTCLHWAYRMRGPDTGAPGNLIACWVYDSQASVPYPDEEYDVRHLAERLAESKGKRDRVVVTIHRILMRKDGKRYRAKSSPLSRRLHVIARVRVIRRSL